MAVPPRLAAAIACSLLLVAGCSSAPPGSPAGTPSVTIELAAQNTKYDKSEFQVAAGAPFAIHFRNLDSLPHNVSIRGASSPMTTEIFGGPDERTYLYNALPQGTYTFVCDVHPEMTGNLISR